MEAYRLTGLPPKERAKKALSRLRTAKVDPRLVIAAWMAVEMAIKDDQHPELKPEYKRVQAAKIVHRMASGTHRKWENKDRAAELHIFPRSRGRVLRHLGEMLERAMELLVDHHLDEIHAFKKSRDKLGKYDSRPYPKGWVARKRK